MKRRPTIQQIEHEYYRKYGIILKNQEQITGIRRACLLAAEILDATAEKAIKGVTTLELNDFAHELHMKHNAYPAALGYGSPPFPKSICTSLNEVVCHGIPEKRRLIEGDILNIDVACILDGYYGDCSKMVTIGETNKERALVVDVAYECLMRSIQNLKPGVSLSTIGKMIHEYATSHGCSVVTEFVGHGVGIDFHEAPQVFHHLNNLDIPLCENMVFTVEPMINVGVSKCVIDRKNHWTARTQDRKDSAQFEHTILITEDGAEILTPWSRQKSK